MKMYLTINPQKPTKRSIKKSIISADLHHHLKNLAKDIQSKHSPVDCLLMKLKPLKNPKPHFLTIAEKKNHNTPFLTIDDYDQALFSSEEDESFFNLDDCDAILANNTTTEAYTQSHNCKIDIGTQCELVEESPITSAVNETIETEETERTETFSTEDDLQSMVNESISHDLEPKNNCLPDNSFENDDAYMRAQWISYALEKRIKSTRSAIFYRTCCEI